MTDPHGLSDEELVDGFRVETAALSPDLRSELLRRLSRAKALEEALKHRKHEAACTNHEYGPKFCNCWLGPVEAVLWGLSAPADTEGKG